MTIHIIGSPVSPYVRKVMFCLAQKEVAFDFDPITPFFGNEEFDRLSPLRRIPVFIDGDFVLNDSTVICEYIAERWPGPRLFPETPEDRARARWIEEYADSRIGDVMIWSLFFQRVIGPRLLKKPTDEARVTRALAQDIPAILDWIEAQLPEQGFLFGDDIMLADVALQASFANAAYAGWSLDAARWPLTATWATRVEADRAVIPSRRWADIMVTTKRDEVRARMADAGALLWDKSHAREVPQPGIMPI